MVCYTKTTVQNVTKMAYWDIMVNMPDERVGQHKDGQVSAKQWSRWLVWVQELLKSKGWVVIYCVVKPQAHNIQCTCEHIAIHLHQGGAPNQLGCFHRWSHYFIWVPDFFTLDANGQQGAAFLWFFSLQYLHDLCKPWWRAWWLVVRL